jgi:predicted nucleotidyltransferase component of viral defense system
MSAGDKFFDRVRRLTITALFSDDMLFEHLVLKGGNAITLAHGLGLRASLDLDFSLASDFSDAAEAGRRAQLALEKRFSTEGFTVIDYKFEARPVVDGVDERPWWGGYRIEFKLLPTDHYERLNEKPHKRSIESLPLGPAQQRTLSVDISKHEVVDGHLEQDLDHFTIRVYSPTMVVAEKLRALCQQMPGYDLRGGQRARARDFHDIYLVVTEAAVDVCSEESVELVRAMFKAKRVPLELLQQLEAHRNFHRPDWPNVVSAVPETLKDYDFYFDFVLQQVHPLNEKLFGGV